MLQELPNVIALAVPVRQASVSPVFLVRRRVRSRTVILKYRASHVRSSLPRDGCKTRFQSAERKYDPFRPTAGRCLQRPLQLTFHAQSREEGDERLYSA